MLPYSSEGEAMAVAEHSIPGRGILLFMLTETGSFICLKMGLLEMEQIPPFPTATF